MARSTALVVGVGAEQGLGAALGRRFAAGGHHVLLAGRTREKLDKVVRGIEARGGTAEAVLADATQEGEVIGLFDRAMAPGQGLEPVNLVAFNAGDNRRTPLRETEAAMFEAFWRVGCLAGFLVGREAARRMAPLGRGTVLFTGATGSLRGGAGFAAFAAAKAGLRMVAQSMAREFGPQGLHVAHVLIDGGIDGERLRRAFPERMAAKCEDGLLHPDAIAEVYWQIHLQQRSAWTQEIDLRPFSEPF